MFNQGFTVSGSSLKLLSIGECGIITPPRNVDSTLLDKLNAMGLSPGTLITVEQRFPRFMVRAGNHRIALSDPMMRAIYVRLVKR